MKKFSFYTLSAAAVMLVSTAAPLTSLAAVSTYQIPFSGGNAFVVGVGGQDCLPGQNSGQAGNLNFNGIPGQAGGLNQNNCWGQDNGGNQGGNWGQNGGNQGENWGQNNGWGAGPVLPDTPDNSLPGAPDNPGTAPEAPEDTVPGEPDDGGSQDEYGDAVAELVNAERAKAGLNPLSVHEGVAEAANTRARELKSTFSHTRPDGSNFSTALTQAGISYRSVGENIAYGQNSPEAVMQSWMNSSGHRANILSGDFTSIGVGHFKDAGGTDYWTQLFIK